MNVDSDLSKFSENVARDQQTFSRNKKTLETSLHKFLIANAAKLFFVNNCIQAHD
jgi:hypothetical protein